MILFVEAAYCLCLCTIGNGGKFLHSWLDIKENQYLFSVQIFNGPLCGLEYTVCCGELIRLLYSERRESPQYSLMRQIRENVYYFNKSQFKYLLETSMCNVYIIIIEFHSKPAVYRETVGWEECLV